MQVFELPPGFSSGEMAPDSLITSVENPAEIFGVASGENILADDWVWAPPVCPAGCSRLVLWSGSRAETLWEADPRTWGPAGRRAFAERSWMLAEQARRAGVKVCFRPHARHVLADPHNCARWATEIGTAPFELLLDPVSMLTPQMLALHEDHLTRMFQVLGALPCLAGVVLANVARGQEPAPDQPIDEGPPLRRAPLHDGAIAPGLIRSLWRAHVRPEVPVLIEPGCRLEQLSMLR